MRGSSPFKRSKVKELPFKNGLNIQKYGSSHFKRQELWELSLQTTKSVGALTLSVQSVGVSALNSQK